MGQALARLQDTQPAWRKADLIRHLGELLPDDVACPDDTTAAAMLTGLADRVLAGGAGERVLMLEAPEWPRVPDSLRRADGRSIYRPHSGTRYTTLAQLTMEERLVTQAQQPGAPRVEPDAGGAAPRRGSGSAGGSAPRRSAELATNRSRIPARGCGWIRRPPRSSR